MLTAKSIKEASMQVQPDPKDVEFTYDEEARRALARVYSLLLDLARKGEEDEQPLGGEADDGCPSSPEG